MSRVFDPLLLFTGDSSMSTVYLDNGSKASFKASSTVCTIAQEERCPPSLPARKRLIENNGNRGEWLKRVSHDYQMTLPSGGQSA